MDNLVICKKCGGNACYEQHIDENTKTWLCMGCGFSTSTVMTEGSSGVKNTLETSPELYKDLMYVDEDKNVWFPATITLPGKGMVFLDGVSKDNWLWSAVLSIDLSKEELASGKYPADQTIKMDMNNAAKFKQDDFMTALEAIGFFQAIE
tara:strand:+ start:3303 stop:3752 length:450 start_codon:yes stop_codon:yes gene_type:complete